jgi:hypothetical protein
VEVKVLSPICIDTPAEADLEGAEAGTGFWHGLVDFIRISTLTR